MVDIGETSERYVFVEESEQTINECALGVAWRKRGDGVWGWVYIGEQVVG